jgi:hypothetical protein
LRRTNFTRAAQGEEKETPLGERIEIGLFAAEPGASGFDEKDVIRMELQKVRTGKQAFASSRTGSRVTPAWIRTVSTSIEIPATMSAP